MSARSCGSCSLCCKVMAVPQIDKPRNIWCKHARPGAAQGCSIYAERPKECSDFECAWVERDVMPESLRPDKVHAFVTGLKASEDSGFSFKEGIAVQVDPGYPNAWKEAPLSDFIKRVADSGLRVIVAVGQKRYVMLGKEWVTLQSSELKEVSA